MIDLLPNKKGIYIQDGEKFYCYRRPWFSISNYRNLRGRSLVIGFVGPRGSGKSVGAARTVILEYMLRGKKVWSNMEIGFNLIANGKSGPVVSLPLDRLTLEELDEVYSNGIIYCDEVNLMMEARRSMSRENLMLGYVLQELRKRRLTIIWSAQSEMHCDDRLRFQTDIIIACSDLAITNPKCEMGKFSKWKAYDFSGVVKGESHRNTKDMLFYEGVESNKPFWNTYNSWEIQDIKATTRQDEQQEEAERIAAEIAEHMKSGNSRLHRRELWRKYDLLDDRSMQVRIGKLLSGRHGIIKENDNPISRYYVVEEEMLAEPVE